MKSVMDDDNDNDDDAVGSEDGGDGGDGDVGDGGDGRDGNRGGGDSRSFFTEECSECPLLFGYQQHQEGWVPA